MRINLPDEFIVFDLEWTAWEGSQKRKWSGPDEYREIFDNGAVLVSGRDFQIKDQYRQLVRLDVVSELPEYSISLTGITQQELDEDSVSFSKMIADFSQFVGNREMYCWGTDGEVIAENCELKKINNPFDMNNFKNMRDVFKGCGVPADDYHSSTIVEYFGKENSRVSHQGLDDAVNIVEALRLLEHSS